MCADHGGAWDKQALKQKDAQRSGAAGNWRDKFVRGPYLREHAIARGVMRDTVETAITWERFFELERKVKDATLRAIREVTGREGSCTVRFTNCIRTARRPISPGTGSATRRGCRSSSGRLKAAASDAMLAAGGTITTPCARARPSAVV